MKTYSHLSLWERDRISLLRAEGICVAEIAAALDRHPGTIYRELGRNSNGDGSWTPVLTDKIWCRTRERFKFGASGRIFGSPPPMEAPFSAEFP